MRKALKWIWFVALGLIYIFSEDLRFAFVAITQLAFLMEESILDRINEVKSEWEDKHD